MKPARRILLFVAMTIAAAPRAQACSQVSFAPLVFPDQAGFVAFSGTVMGYTESDVEVSGVARPHGLVVTPATALVAPRAQGAVEIYPLETRPDCAPATREEKDLREQYPAGSVVTVVGKLIEVGGGNGAAGVTVVVTQADDFGHVARRPESVPQTPEGYLDFRSYRLQYENDSSTNFSLALAWRNAHRGWVEDYEFLRCLKALPSAAQREKCSLLRTMAWYSRFPGDREVYRGVVAGCGLPRAMQRTLVREFDAAHRKAR